MSAMDATMEAALGGFNPTIFGAIEIVLPSHTIRLLTGSGTLAFDGKAFSGADATYGVLYAVEDLNDGGGDQAPAILLTLAPASDAAAADLASASMQSAPVSIWLGVVDPTTGLVVGEPLLIFIGLLDVPTLKVGANTRTLELEISSVMEDFFLNDDGARLNGTFHKRIWPSETGLDNVTSVTQQIYWGQANPNGVGSANAVPARGLVGALKTRFAA